MKSFFKKSLLIRLISYWPPYLGAGVRVVRMDRDFRAIDVEMKLRFWNKNYFGTHFGGSLYSMTDPFLALMLVENLGKDYIVWDKAAAIQFKKHGVGRVRVEFRMTPKQIESIRTQLQESRKVEPVFNLSVLDEGGEVVAEIEKTLYVRRKR
jgi:acyl-coenzyme A thioesterase PaaI-like protein